MSPENIPQHLSASAIAQHPPYKWYHLSLSPIAWLAFSFRRYAVFRGRSTRRELWAFATINLIILLVALAALANVADTNGKAGPATIVVITLLVVWSLAALVPSLSMTVRRLHDLGLSAWWLLLCFVPFLGAVFFLLIMALPGQKYPNRFGWCAEIERYSPDFTLAKGYSAFLALVFLISVPALLTAAFVCAASLALWSCAIMLLVLANSVYFLGMLSLASDRNSELNTSLFFYSAIGVVLGCTMLIWVTGQWLVIVSVLMLYLLMCVTFVLRALDADPELLAGEASEVKNTMHWVVVGAGSLILLTAFLIFALDRYLMPVITDHEPVPLEFLALWLVISFGLGTLAATVRVIRR
jgi:uncharacterized membrane protein YhaH (DUF805 family)